MKKRRARPSASASPAVKRRAPKRVRFSWPLLSLVIAATLVFTVFFVRRDQPRTPVAPAPDAADAPRLIARIRELSRDGRSVEALPLARQLVAGNDEFWQSHFLYAVTLASAQHEEQRLFGRSVPSVRSSRERVAMLRETLEQLEAAERLARGPQDLMHVRSSLGQALAVWGFDWNALAEYGELERLDPHWKQQVESADEDYRSVLARLLLAQRPYAK